MKCTSLTVLSRNTPPSDRVYLWGSGNSHVHVKYWHLWWKRKLINWARERERDGERETEIERDLDPLFLSHRTSTLIWTSFELLFQSVLASKDSSKPWPFWKHPFLEADETPIICLIYILHSRPNENISVTEMNGAPSGQSPINHLATI